MQFYNLVSFTSTGGEEEEEGFNFGCGLVADACWVCLSIWATADYCDFHSSIGLEFSWKEKISYQQQLCERKCLQVPQEDDSGAHRSIFNLPLWSYSRSKQIKTWTLMGYSSRTPHLGPNLSAVNRTPNPDPAGQMGSDRLRNWVSIWDVLGQSRLILFVAWIYAIKQISQFWREQWATPPCN